MPLHDADTLAYLLFFKHTPPFPDIIDFFRVLPEPVMPCLTLTKCPQVCLPKLEKIGGNNSVCICVCVSVQETDEGNSVHCVCEMKVRLWV